MAIAASVSVNHVNDLGWSALQEAVIFRNGGYLYSDIIRMLMDAGARPDLKDNEGKTALDWQGKGTRTGSMPFLKVGKSTTKDLSLPGCVP